MLGVQTKQLDAVNVKLPLIPWTLKRNVDDEPQPVTTKPAPSATVTLDTSDLPRGIARNNFVISNNIQYLSNVSRIRPVEAEIDNWFIPNVNPRNNTFTFYSAVDGNTYTVTVPTGYYDNAETLMIAIVAALNTETINSGIEFQYTVESNTGGRAFTLKAADPNDEWYFVDTCSAITKGDTVYGLPTDQMQTTEKIVGPMMLQYTTYVDIVSNALTKYAKLKSITSNARSSIFARMYPEDVWREIPWGRVYDSFVGEDIKFGFRPNEVVTSIDIQLIDSHGDVLYIPDGLLLRFRLTFAVEL